MSTLQYATQVSPEGYIVLPPEYHNRKVVVLMDEKVDQQQEERQRRIEAQKARIMNRSPEERRAAFDALQELAGCLKDMPGARLISKKQIRSARLEEKYGEQTEEQRKAAGRKFFDTWDGLLEGMPDMTAKEIRAERLEKKYGQ